MKTILYSSILLFLCGWAMAWSASQQPDSSDYPQARDAYKAHQPLPHLPRLNDRTYLKRGSLLCVEKTPLMASAHGGGGTNVFVALAEKTCYLTQATIQVEVADPVPSDWVDYYENYHYGITLVLAYPVGTGNNLAGFVLIRDLTN